MSVSDVLAPAFDQNADNMLLPAWNQRWPHRLDFRFSLRRPRCEARAHRFLPRQQAREDTSTFRSVETSADGYLHAAAQSSTLYGKPREPSHYSLRCT